MQRCVYVCVCVFVYVCALNAEIMELPCHLLQITMLALVGPAGFFLIKPYTVCNLLQNLPAVKK